MLGLGTGEVRGCCASGGMGMWPKGRLEGQIGLGRGLSEICLSECRLLTIFWREYERVSQ